MKLKHLLFNVVIFTLLSVTISSCSDDDAPIFNNPENTLVTNISFKDTNLAKGQVTGKLTWTKPSDVTNLSKISIYGSSDGTTRSAKIADIEPSVQSYSIENLSYTKYFIFVLIDNQQVEGVNTVKYEVQDTADGIYVLNSGSKSSNVNGNLAYYNFDTNEVTYNVFETINGVSLGSTAQDLLTYGSKTYIAVYGSGVIYVVDRNTKVIGKIEDSTTGQKLSPRNLTAYNGKIYATYYEGYAARIDTTSLKVEVKEQVGLNPEYTGIANNNLYVANSGGLNWAAGYDKTVSVIDLATFKETEKITLPVINPVQLVTDAQGDVYVISNGNYGNIPNTLQRIYKDGSAYKVETVRTATYMSYADNKLYCIYNQYGVDKKEYFIYDTQTEKISSDNFVTDGTTIKNPTSINIDNNKKYIYITNVSSYTTNGDLYIFSSDGKLVKKFDTGGLNPMGAYPIN